MHKRNNSTRTIPKNLQQPENIEIAHSTLRCLENVIKIKAGIVVTNNLNERMKNKHKIVYLIFKEVV